MPIKSRIFFLIFFIFNSVSFNHDINISNGKSNTNNSQLNSLDIYRSTPNYDYVMGNDGWPHFRVSFWVDSSYGKLIPYTPYKISTDVSDHGSIENWTVINSKLIVKDMKLIHVFVPKRFVLIYGEDFWKYVYIKESQD